MQHALALSLLALLAPAEGLRPAFVPKRLYKDWVALNSRSTTRHIMLPLTAAGKEECLRLKTEIVAAQNAGEFVVDAFSREAALHSVDEESRTDGGIVGRRLRQGVCTLPELDRASFCSPLGRVSGPLQSSVGYHLVLVEERIGLEMHDGGMTRVVPQPLDGGGVKSVLVPANENETSELLEPQMLFNLGGFLIVSYAGGQLLGALASSIDLRQIAESVA